MIPKVDENTTLIRPRPTCRDQDYRPACQQITPIGDVIRDKTDREYPDYQPHLSDDTYMYRKPSVFGEPETDVEDDDGYPDEQSHPDDKTDKQLREKEWACL